MATTNHYDLDSDSLLGGSSASDLIIPSQKAVKTYVDNNSGGSSSLSGLTDVTLTSPSNGQVLGYDGSKWVNATKTLVTIRDWSA